MNVDETSASWTRSCWTAVLADVKQVTEAMAKATKFRHVGFMAQPGVDVDATNAYGETALMKAAEKGHLDIALFLTEECGADVNVITRYGQTALVKAAEGGHSKIVQYLAKRSADVSVEDKYGSTAIMGAVRHGHIEVVRYLAEECEADVNTDKSRHNAIDGGGSIGACGHCAVSRGIDVNFTNKDEYSGFTALMKATTYRYVEIVRYLVERWNADVNVTDVDGNTGSFERVC